MSQKTIDQIAEGFGLNIEATPIPDHGTAFRVLEGANQIFIGTEEAVLAFLAAYVKERPGPYEGNMIGYKE